MTDAEGMKILRSWILNGGGWPGGTSGEFLKWMLPHFKRIFSGSNIIQNLIDNEYLPDEKTLNKEEVEEFRNRTAQARRQYVYDCFKAGVMLDLNPDSGVK